MSRATPAAAGHSPRMSDQLGGSITSELTHHTAADQAHGFHPLADVFPLMEGEEFDALVADIKAHGLVEQIVVLDDMILDGRNRYRACIEAGIEPTYRPFTGDDPAVYVISANIHRRHLTSQQKRELIAKLVKAQPEKSDRQIGKMAKADNKTVAAVRAEQERREEIPHVSKRTDTKGRKQTAKKKPKQPAKPKPVKSDPRIISPGLALTVGSFAERLIKADRNLAYVLRDIIMHPGVRERLSADLTNGLAEVRKAELATLIDGSDPGSSLRRQS
jgi:hypothetical protein